MDADQRVNEFCRFAVKSLKWQKEFKIIGEVCWLNGVEFRVIDFEMTPKKTAFEFAESARFKTFFFLCWHFFFLSVFRWFYKKRIWFKHVIFCKHDSRYNSFFMQFVNMKDACKYACSFYKHENRFKNLFLHYVKFIPYQKNLKELQVDCMKWQ